MIYTIKYIIMLSLFPDGVTNFPDCSKVFMKANFLSRHTFREHNSRCCRWCQYQSSPVYLIHSHVQRAHPSLRLDKDNKVWQLPQDPVETVPHAASHKPLANITNQSCIMAYTPGLPTLHRWCTSLPWLSQPDLLWMHRPCLLAHPVLLFLAHQPYAPPGMSWFSWVLRTPYLLLYLSGRLVVMNMPLRMLEIQLKYLFHHLWPLGWYLCLGHLQQLLVTPPMWDVDTELCVSTLNQMDVTWEQSKQAGQSSTLHLLSSDLLSHLLWGDWCQRVSHHLLLGLPIRLSKPAQMPWVQILPQCLSEWRLAFQLNPMMLGCLLHQWMLV